MQLTTGCDCRECPDCPDCPSPVCILAFSGHEFRVYTLPKTDKLICANCANCLRDKFMFANFN